MKKTIVFQSFRPSNVPAWLQTCLASVRYWAGSNQYDYELIGDEILALVPDWFSAKASGRKQIITDLGRLILARRFLDEGYDRVVWLDADVLIFNVEKFRLNLLTDFAFGREVWIQRTADGKLRSTVNVHNALVVFDRGNSFLDFYIDACHSIIGRIDGGVPPQIIGPKFLKAMHNIVAFELVESVGCFSPLVLEALARESERQEVLSLLRGQSRGKIFAANLCLSLVNLSEEAGFTTEAVLDPVCRRLCETKGVIINGD